MGQAQPTVVMNEIMYHPVEKPAFTTDGDPVLDLTHDVHEFIEIYNYGSQPVDLSGWHLSGGIDYQLPEGSQIAAGGYVIVAHNPDRLAQISSYGISRGQALGPWVGQLGNEDDEVILLDAQHQTVDRIKYSSSAPWPISANALGADEEWTGVPEAAHQYRGRSLERVSWRHAANDPANWLASPLERGPSPGRANARVNEAPQPIVLLLMAGQAADGARIIRARQPVAIDCLMSGPPPSPPLSVEYFIDTIEATNEVVMRQVMTRAGGPGESRFRAELPGQADRSVVRYRLLAHQGDGERVVSPRPDDPFAWHAYFVTPIRSGTNPVYDLFISSRSLNILRTNITAQPRRVTRPDPPGQPRSSWNATQPAVFVHDGVVYDIQMRHHGSQFRREVSRRSYKLQFPRYHLFREHESLFITDKDYQTEAGHAIFRAAGVPTSLTRWVDLYMNTNARLVRLEQEEQDDTVLRRFRWEQATALHSTSETEELGEIYKAQGIFESFLGPYGRGDGSKLVARPPHWTALQRYEWTYGMQNNSWKGHQALKEMIDALWVARNGRTAQPAAADLPKLRAYFTNYWDIDQTLTYLGVCNWMAPWDDTAHNYFLWRRPNGKWSMLPWDFDNQMNGQSSSTSIYAGAPFAGPNYFKQSFIAAFTNEFRERIWFLNNTLLQPDNLASLGVSSSIRNWAAQRLKSVNTQSKMGTFYQPNRPVHIAPAAGQNEPPFSRFETSPYSHTSTNPAPHLSTTWMVRSSSGSYYEPVFKETSMAYLTNRPIPFERLRMGETYYWRCVYTDAEGRPSIASKESSFVLAPRNGSPGGIVISEVMASNQSAVMHANRFPDWAELYNPAATSQSLRGLCLTDDLSEPSKFVITEEIWLGPGDRQVIWCDKDATSAGLHSGFKLNSAGQTLALFTQSGRDLVMLDVMAFGPQITDYSIGRYPETSPHWRLTEPTPGMLNRPVLLGTPSRLRINEWRAHSAGLEDWFEIYNADHLPVSLEGLAFSDDLLQPGKSPVPPLSFIAPTGFSVWIADGKPDSGGNHTNFRLSMREGQLGIYQTNGTIIDRILWMGARSGLSSGSMGKLPDGGWQAYVLGQASPGQSNGGHSTEYELPGDWANFYGLDHHPLNGPQDDADGDGLTNQQEWRSATNPMDESDLLRVQVEKSFTPAEKVVLSFTAQPGIGYTVESLHYTYWGWQTVTNVSPAIAQRRIQLPLENGPESVVLYRVRTEDRE